MVEEVDNDRLIRTQFGCCSYLMMTKSKSVLSIQYTYICISLTTLFLWNIPVQNLR